MPKTISILGINSVYHESSACLIQDGKLIAAVEEERFNRIKHAKVARVDNADKLPEKSIAYCLEMGGLSHISEVDYIGYSFNPKYRFQKNTQDQNSYFIPVSDYGTLEGEQKLYEANLNVEKIIHAQDYQGKFLYLNHHDCHAASAFYVSGYKDSAVMVIDGIGEFESCSFYKGDDIKLQKIRHFTYPNSLGLLWEKLSAFLGFSSYDAARAMGLSSYGNRSFYKQAFDKILQLDSDGGFVVDDNLVQLRNNKFENLETIFGLKKRDTPINELNQETQKYADLILELQIATEEIFIRLARTFQQETNSSFLCMAGGVSLNCVANAYLSYEQIYDNFYVQPAANDAGTSIGAAYLIWHQILKRPRQAITKKPYLGPEYSDKQIKIVLDTYQNRHKLNYKYQENIAAKTAKLIAEGNIVGWFQGRMEIGPRALGNRSLLADVRNAGIRDVMNIKVKHREIFRPFCPSVLAEKATDWFELPEPIPEIADYMLGAFRVRKEKAHLIPAVVHFDDTSRLQRVRSDINPLFHELLTQTEALTGIPLLLNTSFNDQEPIVCTPSDAVHTFLKTQIDYLAIGNYLVTRVARENKF